MNMTKCLVSNPLSSESKRIADEELKNGYKILYLTLQKSLYNLGMKDQMAEVAETYQKTIKNL